MYTYACPINICITVGGCARGDGAFCWRHSTYLCMYIRIHIYTYGHDTNTSIYTYTYTHIHIYTYLYIYYPFFIYPFLISFSISFWRLSSISVLNLRCPTSISAYSSQVGKPSLLGAGLLALSPNLYLYLCNLFTIGAPLACMGPLSAPLGIYSYPFSLLPPCVTSF